jgi:hypothetical protein
MNRAALMERARAILSDFVEKRTHPHTVRLFRRALYVWCLLNTVLLAPSASQFWAPGNLIPAQPVPRGVTAVLYLLGIPSIGRFYPLVVAGQIVLLLIGLTCVWPRTIALLIYVVTMNLNNRAWVVLDGGDNLIQLMLFYMIFMDPSLPDGSRREGVFAYASNAMTNAAFLMARLQVVAVYVVAGLGKVSGSLWQNGTALYYTLSVDDFSTPAVRSIVAHYPFVSVIGSYVTLGYQLAFPWLIWNRRARPWLMSLGTFIHLQISLVMGLFSFGLAVMTSYVVFFTDSRSAFVLARAASLRSTLADAAAAAGNALMRRPKAAT